jgi:hypothetical protein
MRHAKRRSRTPLVLVTAMSVALLSGCSMFDWMSGGGGKGIETERYDNAPITERTGSIPGDRSNSDYTDEELTSE